MVCLAVTLERIDGMHVPLAAQAASASRGAEAEAGFSPAFSRTSAISRNSFSPGGPAGKKPALGGLLGRVLPGRSRSSNGRRLDRSTSLRSTTSDDMLAGEDPGDECELGQGRNSTSLACLSWEGRLCSGSVGACMVACTGACPPPQAANKAPPASLAFGADGGGLPFGYQEDTGPMFEDDLDDPSRLSRMSPTGAGLERPSPPPHPLLAARAAAAAAAAAGSPSRLAAVGEDGPLSDAVDDSSLSGMRCYVRLVLGRQKHTSFIKKERLNGTVNLQQVGALGGRVATSLGGWTAAGLALPARPPPAVHLLRRCPPPIAPHLPLGPLQTFVFAAPLPLRDRELRVEVYRTASSTQRGRLISIANVGAAQTLWLLCSAGLAGFFGCGKGRARICLLVAPRLVAATLPLLCNPAT